MIVEHLPRRGVRVGCHDEGERAPCRQRRPYCQQEGRQCDTAGWERRPDPANYATARSSARARWNGSRAKKSRSQASRGAKPEGAGRKLPERQMIERVAQYTGYQASVWVLPVVNRYSHTRASDSCDFVVVAVRAAGGEHWTPESFLGRSTSVERQKYLGRSEASAWND